MTHYTEKSIIGSTLTVDDSRDHWYEAEISNPQQYPRLKILLHAASREIVDRFVEDNNQQNKIVIFAMSPISLGVISRMQSITPVAASMKFQSNRSYYYGVAGHLDQQRAVFAELTYGLRQFLTMAGHARPVGPI